jgi:bifunctional UDP-N-acetylglucosamine pyrophosphorylase/glucosamine-1-phosphate N-acetyltransferase
MEASALILAAGAGTRMKSSKPKVAHEILKKPLVRWVVDALHQAGIHNVTTVVGHGRDQVEPLVSDTTTVIQEEQLGTAHAVKIAQDALSGAGSVVVLTGDSPLIRPETINQLVQVQQREGAAVVVLTMRVEDPSGYGRIVRDEQGQVCAIVEHKDCTQDQLAIKECNSGFYCFDKQYLFEALDHVSTENAQGEYYLTDVLALAYKANKGVVGIVTDCPEECLGVNSRSQLATASACLQKRINEKHMENGVTIMDPATTWIGPDVHIDPDTEILPMTFLWGNTSVGSGCVIGPNSRLTDTTVGNNCVLEETIALETQIDNEVNCGPRAYLRPQTHLCDGSKVGTHVEIKKSTVGFNSKVPHLSYMGDATIGAEVNIGAGTITCNYDGEKKWPTTIGDNAFVGSDVMLVAPVSLGDNCLIGAGSVITKDVSSGALGLGRARQTEIEHWNEKKKNE